MVGESFWNKMFLSVILVTIVVRQVRMLSTTNVQALCLLARMTLVGKRWGRQTKEEDGQLQKRRE